VRTLGIATVVVAIAAACGSTPATTAVATAPLATASPTPSVAPTPVATAPPAATAAAKPLAPLSAFQRGMTFADWRSFDASRPGMYEVAQVNASIRNVARTGATWIALPMVCGQETAASTSVFCRPPRGATDAELTRVVDAAHGLGMRVMLKPQIDLVTDPQRSRGHIGYAFTTEAQWHEWFDSYRATILRYAAFAESTRIDMLAIGTELGGTTLRADDWRGIARDVRQVFSGPLTYASLASTGQGPPHGEEVRITWWDALDYIGVDAYYPIASKTDPTVAEMKEAWSTRGYIARLEALSARFGKAIIFTEVGFRSVDGAARAPGTYQTKPPIDLQEQADAYQATLEALWGKPWLAGMFWWQWFVSAQLGGPQNDDFTPFGKPAEEVLRTFYLNKP
jgi:hypothetical protein